MVGLIFGKDAKFNRKAKVEPRSSQGRARSSQVEPGRARSSHKVEPGRARSSRQGRARSSQVEPVRFWAKTGGRAFSGWFWNFPGHFDQKHCSTQIFLQSLDGGRNRVCGFPASHQVWSSKGFRRSSCSGKHEAVWSISHVSPFVSEMLLNRHVLQWCQHVSLEQVHTCEECIFVAFGRNMLAGALSELLRAGPSWFNPNSIC